MLKRYVIFIYFALVFFLPLLSQAEIYQNTISVKGVDNSYQQATQQALVNAVGEIKGVDVSAIDQTFDKLQDIHGEVTTAGVTMPIRAYLASKGFVSEIKAATDGAIDHYQIVAAKKDNNLWSVTLLVAYSAYQSVSSKENQALHTIAVLPFQLDYSAKLGHAQHYNVPQLLYQGIQTNLIKADDFRVMDRGKIDQKRYDEEMRLILSNKASKAQTSRFSQQIGADYLLVGTIQHFIFKEVKKQFYGEDFSQWRVNLVINYRLLETADFSS